MSFLLVSDEGSRVNEADQGLGPGLQPRCSVLQAAETS